MITPNEELRKLAEALQDLLAFHNGPVGGKRPDIFYKIMRRIEEANPAKVIELLDRIDRLEAMYLKLNQHCGALERESEAKDRLLVQARDALRLSLDKDAIVVYTQIKNHLKGSV